MGVMVPMGAMVPMGVFEAVIASYFGCTSYCTNDVSSIFARVRGVTPYARTVGTFLLGNWIYLCFSK
jgi:hypothetical protein